MSIKRILCEGPDDLAIVRALAESHFGGRIDRTATPRTPTGESRTERLKFPRCDVEIRVVPGAKSALPSALATSLQALPPQSRTEAAGRLTAITVLVDPDDEPLRMFEDRLAAELADLSPLWAVRPAIKGGAWLCTRLPDARVVVRVLPWSTPWDAPQQLRAEANLDRLLVTTLAGAEPKHLALVARWICELAAHHGQTVSWKAAFHLALAVVEPKSNEVNAAAKVAQGTKAQRAELRRVLGESGVLRALARLFMVPPN